MIQLTTQQKGEKFITLTPTGFSLTLSPNLYMKWREVTLPVGHKDLKKYDSRYWKVKN